MLLPDDEFKKVIQASPLVSIDLLVRNEFGEYLLGERLNQPAKNYWFVPGGRIRKDEPIASAFQRICNDELAVELTLEHAQAYGVWEHFYPDNFFGNDFSTHYIVLAYIINLAKDTVTPPKVQHGNFKWLNKEQILADASIHEYSMSYFRNDDIEKGLRE